MGCGCSKRGAVAVETEPVTPNSFNSVTPNCADRVRSPGDGHGRDSPQPSNDDDHGQTGPRSSGAQGGEVESQVQKESQELEKLEVEVEKLEVEVAEKPCTVNQRSESAEAEAAADKEVKEQEAELGFAKLCSSQNEPSQSAEPIPILKVGGSTLSAFSTDVVNSQVDSATEALRDKSLVEMSPDSVGTPAGAVGNSRVSLPSVGGATISIPTGCSSTNREASAVNVAKFPFRQKAAQASGFPSLSPVVSPVVPLIDSPQSLKSFELKGFPLPPVHVVLSGQPPSREARTLSGSLVMTFGLDCNPRCPLPGSQNSRLSHDWQDRKVKQFTEQVQNQPDQFQADVLKVRSRDQQRREIQDLRDLRAFQEVIQKKSTRMDDDLLVSPSCRDDDLLV
eukprot:TRINITY_DN9764_c0_g1_i1.p1 TRINITY_DN9764_c0_g1~~TRINITY_DN9764_c0_g1_i1.p1  ORF type:complete len:394 (-),score=52.86 TRINITY_DN9764_c0_g1_i1:53-1234(-)